MSAEGKPQTPFSGITESGSLLGRPLKLLTVLVARFPISVIIISALLVALSLTGAQLSLGFRTSRSDLLNPKSENNRHWAEFTQEFGEQDDVTVVVHGDDPKAVPPILDELAAQLNRQPKRFRSVFHKVNVAKLKSKSLYNDQVSPQFLQQIHGFLGQSQGLLQGDLASLNVGGQITWFAQQIDRGDPRDPRPAGTPSTPPRPPRSAPRNSSKASRWKSSPRPSASRGRTSRPSRKCPLWWPCRAIGLAPAISCSTTVTWDCWRSTWSRTKRSAASPNTPTASPSCGRSSAMPRTGIPRPGSV